MCDHTDSQNLNGTSIYKGRSIITSFFFGVCRSLVNVNRKGWWLFQTIQPPYQGLTDSVHPPSTTQHPEFTDWLWSTAGGQVTLELILIFQRPVCGQESINFRLWRGGGIIIIIVGWFGGGLKGYYTIHIILFQWKRVGRRWF